MVFSAPKNFRFAVKAHRSLTHEIPPVSQLKKDLDIFWKGLSPMYDSGNLGCVLFQFPWSFRYTPKNLAYIRSLKDVFPCEKVIEFRNASWDKEDVYGILSKLGLGFCCVDEPEVPGLFPKVFEVTSKIAYLRFHGRNAQRWFNHKEAWERYDYLYKDEEMEKWLPHIKKMEEAATETYVFFNNCHKGQAAQNAARFKELFTQASS